MEDKLIDITNDVKMTVEMIDFHFWRAFYMILHNSALLVSL